MIGPSYTPAVVGRSPAASIEDERGRRVVDQRRGGEGERRVTPGAFERRQVDKRLDDRTGLSSRPVRAIELRVAIGAATDEGPDRAVPRVDGDQRGLCPLFGHLGAPVGDSVQPLTHRGLRQPLQVHVEGRLDSETGSSSLAASQRLCQPSVDQVDEVGCFDVDPVGDSPDRFPRRRQRLVGCHESVLHHGLQYAVAPGPRPVRVTGRCVQSRRLDDARHRGRLTEGEVAQVLAEERVRPPG